MTTFTHRIATGALSALVLLAAGANIASAKSYGDRYLPLPSAPSAGKLVAAPISDSSMALGTPSGSTLEELIVQARLNKKN